MSFCLQRQLVSESEE